MINGMAQEWLDQIQLRLIGVDHRPWVLSTDTDLDEEGRKTVMKGSKKAYKKAVTAGFKEAAKKGDMHDDPIHGPTTVYADDAVISAQLILFKRTKLATDDMMNFIAHAPEDVDALLKEVFCFREMVTKLKVERDEAVKEMLSLRVDACEAEKRIAAMRRAWRELCKEMGTKP